ncbi:MAG TPA: class I SAM-dependent methyltransferase [Bryobacteraceae bacterium]|jgi:predicted RNA methylase|nr:class I SAM-dependent methyltransferase [Bryobacteraceae bacterium]
MKTRFGGLVFPVMAFVLLSGTAGSAFAQRFSDRDVLAPAYPTPETVVDQMLTIAQVRPGEMVYDLGCGDGRIVIAAAQKYKAHAVGIEIRRDIYEHTLARVASLGLSDQVKIVQGNALSYDLSPADVVTLYLLTSSNERLKPVLVKYLKPSARVVSHDFEIRGWKPVSVSKMMVEGRPHMIYLYRIDAR